MVDFKQILSVSLILFSVIDILGSIPIIINLRKKVGHIQSGKATIVAGVLMITFLLVGKSILNLFGIPHFYLLHFYFLFSTNEDDL